MLSINATGLLIKKSDESIQILYFYIKQLFPIISSSYPLKQKFYPFWKWFRQNIIQTYWRTGYENGCELVHLIPEMS